MSWKIYSCFPAEEGFWPLQLEKLHFHSPQIAQKSPKGRKQLDKIQLPRQETAFNAKRIGYFPCKFPCHCHDTLIPPAALTKTFESLIRPVAGDVPDDPGFHPAFHNGYEVVKVTLNCDDDECWVSLSPLAVELENIPLQSYIERLKTHGWQVLTTDGIRQDPP